MASTHDYDIDKRNKDIQIYINGEFFHRSEAKISVMDSGYLLGDGVWEGIRLHKGTLIHLEDHLDRLFSGANSIAMEIGISKHGMAEALQKTINTNNMYSDVHIRLIVSRGIKKTPYQHPKVTLGKPTVVIIPEYKKASEEIKKVGLTLATVKTKRDHLIQDPRINSLSKLNCIAACIEADRVGADEGIMLDIYGNVSTCNSTNLFMVRDGEVWTSCGEYCLPGITRRNIIKLCRENNITIFEKDYRIEDIYKADEVFVTGTFAGVIPAVQVGDKRVGDGKLGKITKELFKAYKNKINTLYGSSN